MRTVEAGKRIDLKNILFATDFSSCSNAALPYALSIARRFGATLHAAYVKPTDAEVFFASPESWPTVAEADEKRVQARIEQMEKQLHDLPHDVLTPRGKVAEAVASIIEEWSIDLLVLATLGGRGDLPARSLPGSERGAKSLHQTGRRDSPSADPVRH
jgi:nucleotide-binding universal stress UspA family protein